MPARDPHGAQPPLELLRWLQGSKGFYDRKKFTFRKIEDVVMCFACAPAGGGRAPLPSRFVAGHNSVLCMPATSTTHMCSIFGSILGGHFEQANAKAEVQVLCATAVSATVELYQTCARELLPTPTKAHYTFNLRDVAKVFQGLLMADGSDKSAGSANALGSAEGFCKLWINEISRVFYDRLNDAKDQEWFLKMLGKNLEMRWRMINSSGSQNQSVDPSSPS